MVLTTETTGKDGGHPPHLPIDDQTEWLEADGLGGFASGTTAGWYTMVDLQNEHESVAWIRAFFGGDVPAKFRDYSRWGTPSGLSQIMQ